MQDRTQRQRIPSGLPAAMYRDIHSWQRKRTKIELGFSVYFLWVVADNHPVMFLGGKKRVKPTPGSPSPFTSSPGRFYTHTVRPG